MQWPNLAINTTMECRDQNTVCSDLYIQDVMFPEDSLNPDPRKGSYFG